MASKSFDNYFAEKENLHNVLLSNIKEHSKDIERLLKESNMYVYEDGVYRFYHHSFKTYYHVQPYITGCVELFKKLDPKEKKELNEFFLEITTDGNKEEWELSHNQEWTKHTRPILEAMFHCKYFLEMMLVYGEKYKTPPEMLDFGWAAILELYKIR